MIEDIIIIIVSMVIAGYLIYSLIIGTFSTSKLNSNGYSIVDVNKYKESSSIDFNILGFIRNIFKFIFMAIIVVVSFALEIAWLGFLFGSVIGCILMFIFFPEGFLLPLVLMPMFKDMLYKK